MSQPNLMRLSHLVWELRFFSMASQVAHWRVFGPTAYSDHELYKRVYEKLNDLLDELAERLTAFSEFNDRENVSLVEQAMYVYERTMQLGPPLESALEDANATATWFYTELRSLSRKFRALADVMRTEGYLTMGLEDLLASTANDIEILVYFFERRSQLSLGPRQG
jgi:DNA-binding ferritin-like protein